MIQVLDNNYIPEIKPDFIYNRFDLFCNNFIVLKAEHGQEKHIIEARIFDNYAELGIWKMHISNEMLKEISKFLFGKYQNILSWLSSLLCIEFPDKGGSLYLPLLLA